MEILIATLVQALIFIMSEAPSAKTNRFFLQPLLSGKKCDNDGPVKGMPESLVDVCATFVEIMTKRSSASIVQVGDEAFPVSAYVFPVRWWDLAKARRVYLSKSAIDTAEPWFRTEARTVGKVLTPNKVKYYFTEFNKNQEDEGKIEVSTCGDFDEYALIHEFGALYLDSKRMMQCDGVVLDEGVAQILQVKSPYPVECAAAVPAMSEEALFKWLFSRK